MACNDPLVGLKGWKGECDLVQDNIKTDLEGMEGVGHTDRIDLAQGRNKCRAVVNTVMNLRFP
jgi:hypothetical protein